MVERSLSFERFRYIIGFGGSVTNDFEVLLMSKANKESSDICASIVAR